MLNHVLPVLRLTRKKSNALFWGQNICFTYHEITPKFFKCTVLYDTKINAISHMYKPRMYAYIRVLTSFSAIKLLFIFCYQVKMCHKGVINSLDMFVMRGYGNLTRLQSCGLGG